MTTKAVKTAAAAVTTRDEKKSGELTPGNTVDGGGGQNTATGSGDIGVDLTGGEANGAMGLMGAEVVQKAVFFLGPYHRCSRGNTACFDAEYAERLVERHTVVWPEDAERALNPREGTDNHDTDIG